MEMIGFFGLMAIVFVAPIFAYAYIFKVLGIITKNSKCSYFRVLLINFIFVLVVFGMHCLAVTLRKTFSLYSNNSICLIVEWILTIGCGAILFKKSLSLKPILAIVLATGICFAQTGILSFVIPNIFRM